MVNARYLVLNHHGTSIIETFFTEGVALILDFRCEPGHIFFPQNSPYKTQFQFLDSKNLIKSLRIFELQSLKTIITKIVLSIRNFIPNQAWERT